MSAAEHPGLVQFLRFCMVGTVGFLVDAGVLQLMVHWAELGPIVGRVPSFLVAVTVTWLINRRFTFRSRRFRRRRIEYLSYIAAMGLGLSMNFLSYIFVVWYFGLGGTELIGAVAVGSIVGLGFNFSSSKFVIFRAGREAQAGADRGAEASGER